MFTSLIRRAAKQVSPSVATFISIIALAGGLMLPSGALAVDPSSVSIGAVSPGTSVDAGTSVSFTASTANVTTPVFSVTDSFGGSTVIPASINSSTGSFSWTPTIGDIGIHTLTVSVTGDGPVTVTDSVVITVTDPAVANVATESELRAALLDPIKTTINITANVAGITQTVAVERAVTINGGGHSLSFTGLETAVPYDDGVAIVAAATVNNLVVNAGLATPAAWVGTYAIQVFNTTATLNNVTATRGNGGILVNNSTVTLTGAINVSSNGFGGVETSGASPSLNVGAATFTNTSEAYGLPTLWEDGTTGTEIINHEAFTRVIKGAQYQYYLVETNSRQPQAITFADPADQTYGDATSIILAPTASSGLTVTLGVTGDCSVTGITVSFSGAGSCTITASQSGDSTYAPATNVVQSFTIAPRAITVNATTAGKVYDRTNTSPELPTLFAGTIASGDVAVYSQTYASVNVDNGIVINPLVTINGNPANPNYAITYNASSGSITRAPLTPTANADDKVYNGDASAEATASVTPISGDTVTASVGAANFDTKDVGVGKLVNVTGITLGGAQEGNYYLTTTAATTTAEIEKAPLTAEVTVSDKVYDNTTTGTITARVATGLVLGEVVTINGGTAVFDTEHVGVGKTVSVTELNLVPDAVSANYSLTDSDSTTASITARPITVTAQANSKVYDGIDTSVVNAAVTSMLGLAAGDTATFTQTYDAVDVGTAIAMSPTDTDVVNDGNDGDNYSVIYVPANVGTITKKALTITAVDKTKVYGDANPVAAATYSGFVDGEDETDLDTDVTLVIVANSQTDVNNHPITAFGATSGNYLITHVNGNLSITKRPITVTVNASNKVYDRNTTAAATLTPNGLLFGDAVTASHTGATFDTQNVGSGKTVTTVGVALGGADAGNYSVAATATGVADVTARPLNVTATANTKVYGAADSAFSYTSDIVSGDSFSGALGRVAGENVGTYAMNVGTLSAGSNYDTIALTSANLSITPASLTVTADNKSKTYGAANPALTVSYGAFQNGDDENDLDTQPTASTLAVTGSNAGLWDITPAGGISDNYSFVYATGTLTINKANQVITFGSLTNKNFGSADFTVTASSDSLLSVAFTAMGACTVTGNSVHLTTKGLCSITATQVGDTNWNAATSVGQSFTVIDNTIPVISLTGSATETVFLGSTYTDAGATATDDVDGVLSGSIVTVNPVDTNTAGTYTVTYNVSDSSSNAAIQVTRTVEVVARRSSGGGGSNRATPATPAVPGVSPAIPAVPQGRVLGASLYSFSDDITVGSTGGDVTELQSILITGGFLKITAPTGFYGPMTIAAVKLYQAAHGIPATGYVGPLTLAALNLEGTPALTSAQQLTSLFAQLKVLQDKLKQITGN
ncbi:MAG: DUF5011 domain-containing protein [Candidatus Pacebacteria bacterium]|nr:DUF5011 domain-containing protein [Candidatus Paceibacterota bacterium]